MHQLFLDCHPLPSADKVPTTHRKTQGGAELDGFVDSSLSPLTKVGQLTHRLSVKIFSV